MKHFLTPLLFFIGLVGLAQPTYLDLTIQLDNYPEETSWLLTQDNDTVAYVPPFTYNTDYELIEETIPLQLGIEYKFYMFDAFGDGIYTNTNVPNGGFELSSECQTIALFNGDNPWNASNPGLNLSAIDFSFILEPCEPSFIVGCTNPQADNYDPEANDSNLTGFVEGGSECNQDGWSQNYVGINLDYYYQYSEYFEVGLPILLGGTQYYVDLVVANPGNCNSGVALVYVVNDPSLADGIFGTFTPGALGGFIPVGTFWQANVCQYTPGCTADLAINFNPDASLDDGSCIFVTGCTNNEAPNFNPAAVIDDGSCITSVVSACEEGEIAVTIEITLDQFAFETAWSLKDNQGNTLIEYPIGTYTGMPAGTVITEVICLPENTPFTFILNDGYGDGLFGYGQPDGSWLVYTVCEVLSQGSGNFGDIFQENTNSGACDLGDVTGCTDSNYVEFDPTALINDSSLCLTEVIEGCIDPTAFNFDSEANTMEMIPSCNHTLVLTDWASNDWSGAFLILVQDDQYWGPFTLLEDQNEFIFEIELLTESPVKAFFYTPGNSANSANQCRFQLLNPIGDVALEGGSNPFTDPMIPSPYMYIGSPLCGPACIATIEGCLDFEAVNYHPYANTGDGSCYYNPGCLNPGYVEYYNQDFEPDFEPEDACQTVAIFGCTDETALNYDVNANVDNEGCIDVVEGCTNPLAFNYNEAANVDDNSCQAVIDGCTDPDALNYNPAANTENFSCILPIYGCTDPEAFNFDPNANVDDQSCVAVIFGCTDETAYNFNPFANTNVGCISIVYGCTNQFAFNFNPSANIDDGSCESVIYGCTDESAFNYNPFANTNVGCESFVEGCTDVEAINYNPQANTDDGSCEPIVFGCLIPTAFNFNPEANTDNGSCIDVIFGCLDPTAFNYDELANTDNDSCEPVVEGCMDPDALNFDPLANVNNFDCIEAIYGCTDETAINYNELANVDNDTCIPRVEGCMNPEALNFNPEANVDDGSCILPIYGCTDETALNYDADANVDNDSCIEIVEGCTNPEALNYNELANVDDFSCILPIYGCTDPEAFNYNELANVDNDSCEDVVEGCTDPTAFNYNPEANTEDFSCEPFIYGCTDPEAANYDELANTDNGTCETVYADCLDHVIEAYNVLDLEAECFAWVIDVSPSCCNNGWSYGCQELYNYCEDNTVTSLEDFSETQILVFPNPTRDYINIASNLQINAVLYNYIGQPVLRETNVNQLDLSRFEAGMYNLVLTYNDLQFTKKIIKQ